VTERNLLLLAAITSITWGMTGIFVRLLPSVPFLTIATGRLVIALLVVLPPLFLFYIKQHNFKKSLITPSSYVLATFLIGYYLLATIAFQLAPVAEVALLLSTPPIFILIFQKIRGIASSRSEIIGALLAVFGVAIILSPKVHSIQNQYTSHFLGDIIAICAAFLTAIYAYLYRLLAEREQAPESSGVSILTFAIGSFILSLIVILMPSPSEINTLDKNDIFIFLGLGVISTAIPTLGFAIVSKKLPAIITSMISLFIPLFSAIFAYLILKEELSIIFFIGCTFVLGGVAIIMNKRQIIKKV
jgi:drug/metabolite transporter, DME family